MATDLQKILSIGGYPGLYEYLAQGKNNIIVESIVTKQRSAVAGNARLSALSDISIYTTTEEVRLQEVFENMHKFLGEEAAPSSKSDSNTLKALFEKVLPNYDEDRFYVSHMKKVVDWYNCLRQYASLDFVQEEQETQE
jgi:hypothetical protein